MEIFFQNAFAFLGSLTLGTLLPVLLILVVGILAIRLLMQLISAGLAKTKLDQIAIKLIKSLLKTVLYVLLGLILASRLGIDITGIVALASVLTLAVSLSVQSALTNVISGFTLLYTKPFTAGDFVEIAGQSGTVLEVGLTYTRLETPDSKISSIPNSAVTAAEIVNYTASGKRRVDISVSVEYAAAVEDVLAALKDAGQLPTTLESTEPFAAISSYGDSAINYVLQVWCKSEDYWTTLFQANQKIKDIFDEKKIAFAYPHINVHMEK